MHSLMGFDGVGSVGVYSHVEHVLLIIMQLSESAQQGGKGIKQIGESKAYSISSSWWELVSAKRHHTLLMGFDGMGFVGVHSYC